jgi:hypothetical protein
MSSVKAASSTLPRVRGHPTAGATARSTQTTCCSATGQRKSPTCCSSWRDPAGTAGPALQASPAPPGPMTNVANQRTRSPLGQRTWAIESRCRSWLSGVPAPQDRRGQDQEGSSRFFAAPREQRRLPTAPRRRSGQVCAAAPRRFVLVSRRREGEREVRGVVQRYEFLPTPTMREGDTQPSMGDADLRGWCPPAAGGESVTDDFGEARPS